MIEYIGEIIRMTSGETNDITAYIFDEDNNPITEGCTLEITFPDNHPELVVEGFYDEEEVMWHFPVDGEDTDGFFGKVSYVIRCNCESLNFPSPLYLVGDAIWVSR